MKTPSVQALFGETKSVHIIQGHLKKVVQRFKLVDYESSNLDTPLLDYLNPKPIQNYCPNNKAWQALANTDIRNQHVFPSGNLEIWESGVQKIKNTKNLKIQIRSAQNVGKVWISRKKNSRVPFEDIRGHFFHGPKKI